MNNKLKIIFVLALILLGVLIFSVASLTGGIISSYKKPSPRVMSVKCEKIYDDNNPKIELKTLVKNFGEEGGITIIGEIDAAEDKYNDSEREEIYLKQGESENLIFYFDAENIVNARCLAKSFAS